MKRYVLTIAALALAAGAGAMAYPMQAAVPGPQGSGAASGWAGSTRVGTSSDLSGTPSTILDFEDLAATGSDYTYVGSYSLDGFILTSPSCVASASCTDDEAFAAPQPDNGLYEGSTALLNNMPDGVNLLAREDGATFTVVSIDIAEFQPTNLTPRQVSFTGTKADGTKVTQTFTTDGVVGFETFTLQGFTDIVSMSWVQAYPYHQFDNIALDPVAVSPQTETPLTKSDCWNGGWQQHGFRNQGQCIRFVETGKGGQ